MSDAFFGPAGALYGEVTAPPDKSISHRAALFAALSDGEVRISNYLHAQDTTSTLNAIRALGAGSVTVVVPSAERPAISTQDFTCALATGSA